MYNARCLQLRYRNLNGSNYHRTYAVAPQTIVGAGFFRDFSLVAQSLDKPALTGFFILKCVSPVSLRGYAVSI
jgi:hypothetical protein